jgi:hypothetical protein
MVVSTGLKILYSFLYKEYINQKKKPNQTKTNKQKPVGCRVSLMENFSMEVLWVWRGIASQASLLKCDPYCKVLGGQKLNPAVVLGSGVCGRH